VSHPSPAGGVKHTPSHPSLKGGAGGGSAMVRVGLRHLITLGEKGEGSSRPGSKPVATG
jgi:hypothetical protein